MFVLLPAVFVMPSCLPRGDARAAFQMMGIALLCGIGFTMRLFIGMLAFDDPAIQDKFKLGILSGSLIEGLSGLLS